jgi:hypothetical protein
MAFKRTLANLPYRNNKRYQINKPIGGVQYISRPNTIQQQMAKMSLNSTNFSGLVNKVIQRQAQNKVFQTHFTQSVIHNTGYILQKNIFAQVVPGTTSTTREGEHVFMESVDFRLCYTPSPDRGLQQLRVIAYLTTNGTAAQDTPQFNPASNAIGNLMIQTINEDFCKLVFDRIVTLSDGQSGKMVGGTAVYSSAIADAVENITGWTIGTLAQSPAKLLQFKIPINRKLTYASNTLLLGNNVLNFLVIPYESYGTRTGAGGDKIGYIEGSMSINFKDAP